MGESEVAGQAAEQEKRWCCCRWEPVFMRLDWAFSGGHRSWLEHLPVLGTKEHFQGPVATWKVSRCSWTGSWIISSSLPFPRKVGPYDDLRSFPAWAALWFYGSFLFFKESPVLIDVLLGVTSKNLSELHFRSFWQLGRGGRYEWPDTANIQPFSWSFPFTHLKSLQLPQNLYRSSILSQNTVCVGATPHLLINICRHSPVSSHVGRWWLHSAYLY